MPALIANTVTLEEVLEVRAGPLNEEELWSVLSQSCEALHHVFITGKARKRHFGTYTITPATILLCHTGKVKFSLEADSPHDRSYTAPETYARRAFPSEAALEKICVYSLGMSLYHSAEFEVAIGKPISLNEPLENVLLSMCEDSAQSRCTLTEVLQECHSRYRSKNYRDVVASLVESLLGDEIPDIELEDTEFDNEALQYTDTSDYDINGEVYPSSISPVLASPRNLPTPPPPQISTRGQPTSAQLVGSNHRRVVTPPLTQRSTSPRLNGSRNLPPSLVKYKSFLEDSRSKRSMAASLNGLDQLDSREPGSSYHQRPAKQQRMTERTSPHYQEVPDNYERSPAKLHHDLEPRLKVGGNSAGVGEGLRRFSSANSVTSISSSSASGPRSSMFSDGRSSSAVSLTQGSYAPESYLTDGYDSEFYLNSLESSASRNRFINGRDAPSLRDQKYLSVNDLHQSPVHGSLPKIQMSSGKQFTSMPDINKDSLLSNTRRKGASPNHCPVKTFYGPEFIMVTEDPEKSIVNITPNTYLKKDAQQKKGGSQNRKMVTVVALNGQKLQLMAEVSMTTKDLYDHVIKFLGITEKSFFGLAKLEDEEVIFLELDVKLSKYAPPRWKEPKGEMVEFILYFRVKFYVEHLALLSHLSTRHQFYLQLRKDVLEGRLYCHEEAAFMLAGLALQAETSDFDDSLDQEYFLVEHYLHPRVINKVSTEYAVSQLPDYHLKFTGLSEEQAELDFLEEAQKLPEYGIHFYKVQANKKSDAEKLYLGICVRGITVYESMGHIKSPIHKHSWPLTKKISFKKKKFFIEPRGNPDGAKLTFYTNHYKKAKYLLSMCTAFHRFQMKMRTRLASIEHEVALDFAAEKQHQQQQQLSVDNPPKPSPYERSPPSYKQGSVDTQKDTLPRSVSQEYKHSTEDLRQYREMSVDINHNIGFHGNGVSDRNKLGKRMLSTPSIKDDLEKEKHDDEPYVIDSTLNDPHKKDSQQDAVKDNLHQNTDNIEVPRPKDILKSPDREIRVIKLRKEPFKGLGITVLGGENSKRLDLGIYVKSITEGGAAAKDGRLKAGDRILAVNGNSVENVTHEQAVSLLKTTSSTVELVVSQSPHNVSALDLSSIPSAASANEEPQTLEVKPLITPPQHSTQLKQQRVESPWSSDTESPPSTFNFPSEDEPVTMISKSISSLAAYPPASKHSSHHPVPNKEPYKNVARIDERLPEPVTLTTVQALNSQSMEMMSQEEPAPPLVDSRVSSLDSHQSEISSESYTAGSVGSERSTDHEISDKSFIVKLEKVNGSLGLSVTGGINTTVKHGAIFVKSLILNGPADLNGNVRVGDRILEVNGLSLNSVTHKQAVEIIKRAPQHCKLLIDRSIHVNVPTSIKKTSARSKTPDRPFVVELMKGIGGLGLSLVGGRDAEPEHAGLLRIKKMFPGQPAAISNKLQVGDIVLEVNGKTLETATHQDAINMIRIELSVVRLLVKREPSSIPAVLLNRAASDASDIDPVQLLSDIQTKLRSDVVKSPPQETHTYHTALKLEPRPDVELTNERDLPDRTEVWVKQGSPIPHGYGFENERSLTHQLSAPSGRTNRHMDHETVTTSHSLPGKFAVKSRYFEKVPEEGKIEEGKIEEKAPIHSYDVDVAANFARKDSDKIVSEPDIHSLLKHIQSQDSLQRTMSPRAPLAEYEESDIDEGIMISVDDGTVVHIDDDGDDNSDNDDDIYDIDTTLTNAVPPISDDDDDKDSDDNHTPTVFRKRGRIFDDDGDDNRDASKAIPTLTTRTRISDNDDDDDDDDDSIVDSENSDEDIEEVLKLLEAAHRDTQEENTNTISSGKSIQPEQTAEEDEISVDIQQALPEQSPYSLDFSLPTVDKTDLYRTEEDINKTDIYRTQEGVTETNIYRTESEPNEISLEDDEVNNLYVQDDHPQLTSFSAINGGIRPGNAINGGIRPGNAINGGIRPGNHGDDDDDESESDVSIDENQEELQDAKEEETDPNSILTVEDNDDNSRLTPKEELLTVELEKRDSGGLGFTLAGGADTMGGCFVRDIIGDPAKADGTLQKGDQILQVDDTDIRDMKHMQAVNVLRGTKKNVKLIVLRRPALVVSEGNSGQLESINLTRTSRGRIGLLLTEGDDGVILVDDVVPGEPAAVEGNLKHGDRIVEIGGRKVDGVGFLAARQYLDAARPVVQLLVERRNRAALSKYSMGGASLEQSFSLSEDIPVTENVQSDEDNTDDNQESDIEEQEDEVIQIELDKGTRGFGFSLVAAPTSEPNVQGIFIKTISPGSVAEQDGRLRVGDQILTVNQEYVHGLSHARVIGMLRKVTTTVTMEIQRPGDTMSKTTTGEENPSTTSPSKTTNRSPLSNSLDLDITLEDKETLTDSSEVKDEDDIVDLLTTISSSNSQTTPPTTQAKPKLSKRDTDSVLSSLLSSIGLPSSNTNYLHEVDSNDSDSDADTSSLPDSVGYLPSTESPPLNLGSPPLLMGSPPLSRGSPPLSRGSSPLSRGSPPLSRDSSPVRVDYPPLHMGSPPFSRGSPPLSRESSPVRVDYPPLHMGSPPFSRGSPPLSQSSSQVSVGYPPLNLDNSIDKDIPGDSLRRFSSSSSEDKKLSISSNERLKAESEETSSDSDYDDVDVFDMLHDNSENNTQKQSIDIAKKTQEDLTKIIDSYANTPPPLPTTPIPSDDEEDLPPPPPRKESLLKSSDDNWSSGQESDFSSQPKVNGFVSLHSSSSEGEMMSRFNRPLVDVISGGRYTGHKLKMLIGALQTKLNSNAPSDEFKALRGIKLTDGCEAAKHPDNKEKNRYRNVLPFDSTRVRLSGEGNEDYINASHIRVPVGHNTYHYIATQGPLPNTIRDFWQMVWEQGIEVIAMVTLEQEGGKVKCNRYWPESLDKPLLIPRFEVRLQGKKKSESFVERKIYLKHLESGDSIEVTQLSFTTWPDHGVPKCSVEIVQFVTYMRDHTSTQAPILVHCSAGIGRTGALITVDVSLGLIQRDLLFDVDKIIRILREQRQGMIQTKDQYIFCYKACLEVLRSLAV